jgi:glucose/mannose transport system substrate-binding protein
LVLGGFPTPDVADIFSTCLNAMSHVSMHLMPVCRAVMLSLLTLNAVVFADEKPELEILHWWSSAGEVAALNVLVDAYRERGGVYYDSATADQPANREQAIERIAKGYPATMTQWNAGRDIVEFHDLGLIDDVSDPKLIEKLQASLAPSVLEVVTHKEKVLAMPVGVHSENWMWFGIERLQLDSDTLTGDWQGLLEQGQRLASQGIPLLAVGDQPWQVRILFTSLFLGISRDAYKRFYLSADETVTDSDAFHRTLVLFNRLAKFSQSFGDGSWSQQVAAVADGKAAAVFMGDWAKGEFQSLGKSLGRDYGCAIAAPDDPSLLIVVDAFILGKVVANNEQLGQKLMLEVLSDHETNTRFNALKGSLSPYLQPASTRLDDCSEQGYRLLASNDSVIPPYASYQFGAILHKIDGEIYRLWTRSMNQSDDAALIVESTETFRAALLDKAHDLKKMKGYIDK